MVVFGVESNVDQVGVSSQISGGNLLHYAELSQYYYDDDISTSSSDLMSVRILSYAYEKSNV